MINPSTSGWIDKFFSEQKLQRIAIDDDVSVFYNKIRDTGLIFGYPISFENIEHYDTSKWTNVEFTKVALLVNLYNVFEFQTHQKEYQLFIKTVVLFYKNMLSSNFSWLSKVLPDGKISIDLENVIEERIQTNENVLSRNFSHILTNALLFEDILAFQQYLIHGEIPNNYLKNLEESIISLVSLGLNTKSIKSNYDQLLIKLFESSVRYTKFAKINNQNLETLQFDKITTDLERYYLLDLTVLSLWNDSKIEGFEEHFLIEIAKILKIDTKIVFESIASTDIFIQKYKSKIPYFNYANPVKHFYDHTTQAVTILIARNKLRLQKELGNNGELALLLAHSTHRSLNDLEKKKIKKQLLEICKSIPSLAVFLLPGGSLLLPILIKFIPKLLPDTFNENVEPD